MSMIARLSAVLTVLVAAFTLLPAAGQPAAAAQEATQTEIASGTFTNKNRSKRLDGSWRIYESDGKTYLTLSDDFRTSRAPDLKIFLSPTDAASVTRRNATNGSLLVSPLRKTRGGQTYEIPEGTDLSAYESLVIHCQQFSVLWGAGAL